MLKTDPKDIQSSLLNQAEILFGKERTVALQPEIEVMSEQLSVLRTTPVDLQDEP